MFKQYERKIFLFFISVLTYEILHASLVKSVQNKLYTAQKGKILVFIRFENSLLY